MSYPSAALSTLDMFKLTKMIHQPSFAGWGTKPGLSSDDDQGLGPGSLLTSFVTLARARKCESFQPKKNIDMDLCHFWHFSALLMTDVFQNDLGRSLGYFLHWPGRERAELLAAGTQRMNQNLGNLSSYDTLGGLHRDSAEIFKDNQTIFIGLRSKISWVHTSLPASWPSPFQDHQTFFVRWTPVMFHGAGWGNQWELFHSPFLHNISPLIGSL